MVGSDGVIDVAESLDFHREGVAVVDRGAVEDAADVPEKYGDHTDRLA